MTPLSEIKLATQDKLSHYYFGLPYISLRGKERKVIDYWVKKEAEDMNRSEKDYQPIQEGYKPDRR